MRIEYLKVKNSFHTIYAILRASNWLAPPKCQSQETTSTPWYSTQVSVPEQELKLNIHEPSAIFNDNDTLVLTIAIEFGTLDAFGNPTPIRRAGAGKILGVG